MAIAETVTQLPIDRFFQILGTDPMHANGVYSPLFNPPRQGCDDIWLQYDWQDAQKVSRESLALAIKRAEDMIKNFVGYNLIPWWEVDEEQATVRPGNRQLYSTGINVRAQRKTIKTDFGHLIAGGIKGKTVIEAGAAIVRSDGDGDGYSELCTVTVNTTITDTNEIRVFYSGTSGADNREIRPLKSVTANGVTATITFYIWQVVDLDLISGFGSQDSTERKGVDGDVAGNFETTVDVYRVYNDISQMVQFLWEPYPYCNCSNGNTCTVCQFETQFGCLRTRDRRLGQFAYAPATYDSDTNSYTNSQWINCRSEPDKMRLWYYSGFRDNSKARPHVEMDNFWEQTIVYLAIALLDREMCLCDNSLVFWQYWQDQIDRADQTRNYQIDPFELGSRFGKRRGAIEAWNRCHDEGRKLPR